MQNPLRTMRRWVRLAALPTLGAFTLIALWWLIVRVFNVQAFILPAPDDIVKVFVTEAPDLLTQIPPTLVETLEGFAAAAVGGLLIALAVTTSRTLYRMFYPLLVAANAVPKLALAPLVLAWFGPHQMSKVVLVFLVCFFPVVVSAVAGLTSTPADLAELARSLSASRSQAFQKVRLPGALPHIFVGLRVAAGLAVIGAVISEFSGAPEGLGYAVNAYSGQGMAAEAFAALILLSVMSIALYYPLVWLEKLLLPWAEATAG